MTIRISIAMCTQNGERFLSRQLESIAAQKRLPDELVVCDDRSSDATAEILWNFARRAPFAVQVSVNEQHLGSTRNFEKSISLCSGEIVALADQDDTWYPNKLEIIEQAFCWPVAPVAVFSDADLIDGNSLPLNTRLWNAVGFTTSEQRRAASGAALNLVIKHPIVTGATMAFRRSFFDFLRPFPPEVIHDRWMSILLASSGPVASISEPLMRYRKHRDQQIGVRPETLPGRMQIARLKGELLYFGEIEFFRRALIHLERRYKIVPRALDAIPEIEKKISHLERRVRLRRSAITRFPAVLREVCNHGYWRYSAGWQSVAKDLFLPANG